MSNKKVIILSIIIFLLGLTVGVVGTIGISKLKSKPNQETEQKETKMPTNGKYESPYTLEEIYEIIEDPERYYSIPFPKDGNIAYILCHFYDYFSKGTPFKIATKVEIDPNDSNRVSKVLEVDYITYAEYLKANESFEFSYKNKEEICKESPDTGGCNDEKYGMSNIMYNYFADQLVYAQARAAAKSS